MIKKLSALLFCFLLLPTFAAATGDSPLLYGDENVSIYYSSFYQDSDDEYVYLNLLLFNKSEYRFSLAPSMVSLNSFSFEMDGSYRVEPYSDLLVALPIPRDELEKYPIEALESVALDFRAAAAGDVFLGRDISSRTHIIQAPDADTGIPSYETNLHLLMEHLNSVGGLLFADENVSIQYSSFHNERSSDLAYLELIISTTHGHGFYVSFHTIFFNDSPAETKKNPSAKIQNSYIYRIMSQSHRIIQVPIDKTELDEKNIDPLERISIDFEYLSVGYAIFAEFFDNDPLILQ